MSLPHYVGRLILLLILVCGGFAALSARLVSLHLGPNDSLKNRVRAIRESQEKILVGRGRILDAQGVVLAVDMAARHVIANPKRVLESGHTEGIAHHLGRVLGMPPATILPELNRPRLQYRRIKPYVAEPVARQISRMNLPGIYFEPCTVRRYPAGGLMAHVLGFANWEGVGSAGIEQTMNEFLKGIPGLRVNQVDGRGRSLYDLRALEVPPQAGSDVHLTLDRNLQQVLEDVFLRSIEEYNPEAACAIVQRVRTGDIVAMASYPRFDPNEFRWSSPEERRNRCVGMVYEPGSTFKVVTLAAALDAGVVGPDTAFDCEQGQWYYGGRRLRDYHPYGTLSVRDILKKSSNIGSAKIALRLGEERLAEAIRAFGFGRPTGIELPAEEVGIVHDPRDWSAISITRIPMGHEIAVTPLQMLNAVSAIANDGVLMRPRLLKKITSADGQVEQLIEPRVLGRPLRMETARQMQRMMARVTEQGGTGRRAALGSYSVAGKTGTAQKIIDGVYSETANVASFVGFAPATRPELAMIVVMDNPQPLRTGGRVAAPVFQAVMAEGLRYLDIPADLDVASNGGGR